jgi:ADP-glucose pyrophosphorylase
MKIDNKGRILSFSEKPKGAELKAMVSLMFIIVLNIIILQVSRIRLTANTAS